MKIDITLKKKVGIYKISSNGVIYIGSSIDLFRRLTDHFRFLKQNKHQNPHLQNHYNKYGENSFSWEVLEFCTIEERLFKETWYIEELNCFNKGFNQSKNSYSPLGYKHTEECKKIMSLKKLNVKQTEEQINKRKFSLIGKIRTEEHKKKYSESKLGEKNPNFGKKEDPLKTKERMRNLHMTPKWNKGLTKETSEKLKCLSDKLKNRIAPNNIKCELIDIVNNIIFSANSLKELSEISPLSLATINRLKNNKAGIKITNKYKLIW